MAYSSVCAIDLPDDFDLPMYEHLNAKVARLNEGDAGSAYRTFGSAWLGVGYRIAATLHYDAEFRVSIEGNPGPAGKPRFTQERALFGCAASAVSCIDCFAMASYAVGSLFKSTSFPMNTADDLKPVSPASVAKAYLTDFAAAPFAKLLREVADSSNFRRVKDVRDVLSHRGALLRWHNIPLGKGAPYAAVASNPKALAEDFNYSAILSDESTGVHAQWTLAVLNQLLQGLSAFIDRR